MLRIPSFIRFGLALDNLESIVKAWFSLPLPKFMAETSKEGDGHEDSRDFISDMLKAHLTHPVSK